MFSDQSATVMSLDDLVQISRRSLAVERVFERWQEKLGRKLFALLST